MTTPACRATLRSRVIIIIVGPRSLALGAEQARWGNRRYTGLGLEIIKWNMRNVMGSLV